ncbi:tripartite tricarboxylate transporter substrate-binding protein [Pararoseomonas sp. SCSIO 73927]|uniref:Bug family tripartite tricarboxylate transporter substrate binding protein n=1 Tax=Pararoseomonas sp. SCSIO 73927 TaxID=3114537 RepID=UPI0030D2A90B
MGRAISRRSLGAALAAGALARQAAAQSTDPARIIVPFPPGAASDGIARLLAERMVRAGTWGSAVLTESRPGAGGNIAGAAAARARPDGRSFLLTIDSTLTVNPHLYPDLGYDPDALEPVALMGTFAQVLLAHPSSGVSTLPEFLAAARGRGLAYASGGVGTPGQLAMEAFRLAAGLPATALSHVPYRGSGPALTDLIAGNVPVGFLAISGAPDFVRDGRVRAIAVSSAERLETLPAVPTVAELGFPGLDMEFANLLIAPKGIPAAARDEVAALAVAMLREEPVRARFAMWNLSTRAGGPEEAGAWIARARPRWGEVVRATGMRAE